MRLFAYRAEGGLGHELPGPPQPGVAYRELAPGEPAPPDLTPAPPLPRPGKIVCIGLNYAAHVAEGGRAGLGRPRLFAKFSNAVIADGEPIVRPKDTDRLDLEVELGFVVGRHVRHATPDEAATAIGGYLVTNDVSARNWQGVPQALREGEHGDGQWLRAKGSDTFLPMGPVYVSADEIDPVAGVRLRSFRIPGSGPDAGRPIPMQDDTTASMIWKPAELVVFITEQLTLEPGDVVITGTPSGVGVFRDPPVYLEPGDRARCEIEGIGAVENPVIDWNEDRRPLGA